MDTVGVHNTVDTVGMDIAAVDAVVVDTVMMDSVVVDLFENFVFVDFVKDFVLADFVVNFDVNIMVDSIVHIVVRIDDVHIGEQI